MKVKSFELSDKNEATAYPYWIIIDPCQMMKPDCHMVASMITGIFFSRESAEEYLKRKSHHFSNKAVVYCHSGYDTDWEDLIRESKEEVSDEKTD